MSIEIMTAVWDRSTAYGGDLLILLAIANYADINGRAYPSIRTLSQRGRMTERNAQYCIQKLEALGELKVDRNAGPHGTHIFQVVLGGEKFSGGEKISGVQSFRHQRKSKRNNDLDKPIGEKFSGVQSFQGEAHFTGGVKPISPEPSLDPSVLKNTPPTPSQGEPTQEVSPKRRRRIKISRERPTHAPDAYDAFYAAYPKHKNPDDAIKAWDERRPDESLQALILKNVTARARDDPDWLKDAGKFIPYPATYLRNSRWKDEWKPISERKARFVE